MIQGRRVMDTNMSDDFSHAQWLGILDQDPRCRQWIPGASSGGPDRRRGVSAHLGLSEMAVHVGGLCQQPQPQGRGNKVMPKGPPWGLEYPVSWRRLIMGGQWPDQWICWVDEAAVLCHKDVDCKKPENGSGHNLPLDTACSWLLGQWFGAGPKSNGSTIYIYIYGFYSSITSSMKSSISVNPYCWWKLPWNSSYFNGANPSHRASRNDLRGRANSDRIWQLENAMLPLPVSVGEQDCFFGWILVNIFATTIG